VNKTVLIWMLLCMFLTFKSFQRPSYAVGVYMLTFFAHPFFWWWGDILEGFRWNFFGGILLLVTLVATNASNPITGERPLQTNAVKILALVALNAVLVHVLLAVNPEASLGWLTNKLKFILLFFLLQYAIKDQKDYRIVVMSIVLGMGYIGYEATINERGSFSSGRRRRRDPEFESARVTPDHRPAHRKHLHPHENQNLVQRRRHRRLCAGIQRRADV
jgi:hypothetical protein